MVSALKYKYEFKMKKVTVVHHYGGLGGAGKSLLNNVRILVNHWSVHVILPAGEPSDIDGELKKIKGVRVSYFDFIPSIPLYSGGFTMLSPALYVHLVKSFVSMKSFCALIEKTKPDLLIVNSLITSWLSVKLLGVRKICFVRETQLSTLGNVFLKYFLNRFDKVVFISNYDSTCWGLSTEVCLIENTVEYDEELAPVVSVRADKFKLLYLGGTSYIKGFYFLLASLILTKCRHEIEITILGAVDRRVEKLISFLLRRYLNIVFVGKVSNVSKYYIDCDAVIFPVVKVHQGRPIFEAGYHHKAVIVPDFDNLKEYVDDGVNGFTYYKGSCVSLANVFENLLDNYSDVKFCGDRNYEQYLSKHTKKHGMKKLTELLHKL
jgi:glycosyltransferase involved in cell wall biosynthesis